MDNNKFLTDLRAIKQGQPILWDHIKNIPLCDITIDLMDKIHVWGWFYRELKIRGQNEFYKT